MSYLLKAVDSCSDAEDVGFDGGLWNRCGRCNIGGTLGVGYGLEILICILHEAIEDYEAMVLTHRDNRPSFVYVSQND